MKKTENQEKQIQKILSELSQIQSKYTDKQIAKVLSNVEKELKCLV